GWGLPRFTLAFRQDSSLWHFPSALRRAAVSGHPALWSPDFPPTACAAGDFLQRAQIWHPIRDSNPCFRLERTRSSANRRTGRISENVFVFHDRDDQRPLLRIDADHRIV